MIDEYQHAERMAIVLESGGSYSLAKQLADAEQAKPECSAVDRLNAHRAKVASDKLAKQKGRYEYK